MKAKITVDLDNAAFEGEPATELARILHDTAQRLEDDDLPPWRLRDSNGNAVGWFSVESEAKS